jgi:thiol-disulfide isomerase/thioredoxin
MFPARARRHAGRFREAVTMKRWMLAALAASTALVVALSTAPAPADVRATTLLPFDGNGGWINSPPLKLSDLSGKVVLVDFWEYTCINCLRTLPYLQAWYQRYRDDGFVIVGVHTPEFGFSGDSRNVQDAAKRLGVTWPVVLDPDFTLFKRYQSGGWPTEFLFDQSGTLVAQQYGEGGYQDMETKIQSLLRASNKDLQLPAVMALLPQDDYTKPGSVCYPQTPETFVGPWHGQSIADQPVGRDPSGALIFNDSNSTHQDGMIYLQGYWNEAPQGQGMISGDGNGYVSLVYQAIQVVAVLKTENGGSVRVNVDEDGKPVPRADAGADMQFDASGNSYVTVDAPRAYGLLTNKRFGKHELRLLPTKYGVGFYSFDFESCVVGSDT